MSRASLESLLNWAGLALGLFVLNFALTIHNVWPKLWITTRYEISIEIAVLVLALTLYVRHIRPLSPRVLTLLALVLTIMAIGRYAEVTAPALYGRPVNIYWDAQYLPHVAAMIIESANPLHVAGLISGIVLFLGTLFAILRYALVRVTTSQQQRTLSMLAGLVVVVYISGYLGLPVSKLRLYSIPVTKTYWQQAEFIATAISDEGALDVLPAIEPLGDFELPKLNGADVVIHFMESYGAIAFDSPAIATAIAPGRAELAAAIAATNRRVVSAYVVSPTFGGNSWLAHSSFMTGLDINKNSTYDLLLTEDRPTLASRFTALGYKSVALMPGLRSKWPEGMFYKFENTLGSDQIDYRGPEFGWWRIPDQYSLARLAELEMAKTTRVPLFLVFTTISSHMPFRPTPPYQPDWSRILSSSPFDEASVQDSLALLPEWTNLQPAYAGTLSYTFNYLGGFFREHPDQDFFWVIIGDHQPVASVSGEGARWDVPVHIVSANDEIIDALLQQGFVEGLTPAVKPIGPMYELPTTLLGALGRTNQGRESNLALSLHPPKQGL